MPTCSDCGNDDRFHVTVVGEQTISFGGSSTPDIEDDRTEWSDATCAECDGVAIEFG